MRDDYADRRVEITGPTDRKMVINALNSGAKVWLADLEDASTPTWANVIDAILNLRLKSLSKLEEVEIRAMRRMAVRTGFESSDPPERRASSP
mgnify:CR=1 FL=1